VKKGEVNSSASFVFIAFPCATGYFQSYHPTTVTSLLVSRNDANPATHTFVASPDIAFNPVLDILIWI
jgi:hypothetical protein